MACRGVYFALDREQEQKLFATRSDDEVLTLIQEEIEEAWDEEHLVETDKAWDAIHRCLTDGSLDINGNSPTTLCVLGGRQFHRGHLYIVAFKNAFEVPKISLAISSLDKEWLAKRFATIAAAGYEGPGDQDDFEYTWNWFQQVQEFYKKAASDGRSVIFTVDQ